MKPRAEKARRNAVACLELIWEGRVVGRDGPARPS